jgi:hypothetical protein
MFAIAGGSGQFSACDRSVVSVGLCDFVCEVLCECNRLGVALRLGLRTKVEDPAQECV